MGRGAAGADVPPSLALGCPPGWSTRVVGAWAYPMLRGREALPAAVMVTLSAEATGGAGPRFPTLGVQRQSPVTSYGRLAPDGGGSPYLVNNLAGEPKMQLTLKFLLWKWKLRRSPPLRALGKGVTSPSLLIVP